MILLPPRSKLTDTLFPITTLFRSCQGRGTPHRRRIGSRGAYRLGADRVRNDIGSSHPAENPREGVTKMKMENPCLIVSIVRKGWGGRVLDATIDAGAHGGTVLFGRGIGRNEQQKVFGIQIEPEKEIVLTVIPSDQKDRILQEVVRAAELHAPGHGLAFIVPVEAVAGIVHLVEEPHPDHPEESP